MSTAHFTTLAPGLGIGDEAPSGWKPLSACQLLILVGVTGVGKSTALDILQMRCPQVSLLPDRRSLTDRLILPAVQAALGRPAVPVSDRGERFALTRRYRELHPGGMAHALARLYIRPAKQSDPLVFDGLRGAEECSFAARVLPQARFAVLHAPDAVRVRRLLGRGDTFDRMAAPPGRAEQGAAAATEGKGALVALGIADAGRVFSLAEQEALAALAQSGEIPIEELRAKVQIVLEERRSYDPGAAIAMLQGQAAGRMRLLDTSRLTAAEAAAEMGALLGCRA